MVRLIYSDMFEVHSWNHKNKYVCQSDLIGKLMNPSTTTSFNLLLPSNNGLDDLGLTKGIIFNSYDDWSYHRRVLQKTIMKPQFAKETVEYTQVLFRKMEELWKRLGDDIELI